MLSGVQCAPSAIVATAPSSGPASDRSGAEAGGPTNRREARRTGGERMGAVNVLDRAELHAAPAADEHVGGASPAARFAWIGLGIVTAAVQLCWLMLLVYVALRWVS